MSTPSLPFLGLGAQEASRSVKRMANLPRPILDAVTGAPSKVDGKDMDEETRVAIFASEWTRPEAWTPTNYKRYRLFGNSTAILGAGSPIPISVVKNIRIKTRSGYRDARIYRPVDDNDELLPGVLFLHGGSWVFGNLDTHDNLCRMIANSARVSVISFDYSLSPEHIFPTAINEIFDAWLWIYHNSHKLKMTKQLAVAGDSAGGNMATVTCIKARDEKEPMPAFQLLFVPAVTFSGTSKSFKQFSEGFFLTEADMQEAAFMYLGGNEELVKHPYASPLANENLSGLPPAHIAVAGFDPLRDHAEEYAKRLAEAGNVVDCIRHSSLVHPFANMIGISRASSDAVKVASGALRMGLSYHQAG